jgi:FAD:protein FMN transferase
MIDRLEEQLSIYRDDSEIKRINERAAAEPVRVERLLFRLLERCRALSQETAGAFDITAGPLVRAWGFTRREGRIPTAVDLAEAHQAVGMDQIQFDAGKRTVAFRQPGVEINLGAVGKGYALDRVGSRLARLGYRECLLSAGSSSLLAIGKPSWDDAWLVDIRDPLNRERPIAVVSLIDSALSTSGSGEQFFEHEGRRYGHIIDPRSGHPAAGVLQVTVIAPDATLAEALSTAFFINGIEWADTYCEKHAEIGALMVSDSFALNDSPIIIGRMRDHVRLEAR